jgi:hypothetical protein
MHGPLMSLSLHWLHDTGSSTFPQKYVISNEKYFIRNVTTCNTVNLDEHAASCHMSLFNCQIKSSILEDNKFDNHHQMNSKSHINVMLKYNTVSI